MATGSPVFDFALSPDGFWILVDAFKSYLYDVGHGRGIRHTVQAGYQDVHHIFIFRHDRVELL